MTAYIDQDYRPYTRPWYYQRSLQVRLTLRDKIEALLDDARWYGLRVRHIKLSVAEFRALLADPDFVDRYSDGCYRGIPLRLVGRDVWT